MTRTVPVRIELPGGAHLEAVVAHPGTYDSAPALVVAPGSGYTKEGLLIAELCNQAASTGFVTLRFDWRYATSGGRPSSNRKREMEDLQVALKWLESRPGVDVRKMILAGKSMGAAVVWRVFQNRLDILAAMLLTPVFRDIHSGPGNYPGLPVERRPVYLLTGKSDPLNKHAVMQVYLQNAHPDLRIHTVEGNHGLELSRSRSPEAVSANQNNIANAVSNAVDWLRAAVAVK